MKELTIEEKARAYDEVRKKIALRFGSDVAEKIFSEFEMSEDEKVRKELINVFSNREKYLIDKSFGDITVSEVLAWLEKQGEKSFGYKNTKIQQKDFTPSIKPKFKAGDKVIGIFSGMRHCILEVHNDHYYTETGNCIMFYSQDNFRILKQKDIWSKNDEIFFSKFNALCEMSQLDFANDSTMYKDFEKMKNWLKSLKDRVVPQPKHKWSIEDERVIAIINNALTESNTPPDDYDKVYDWLESLRKRIGR